MDRGTPIDRFYIEKFVKSKRKYISGNIYEIGDDFYSKKYAQPHSKFTVLTYKENEPFAKHNINFNKKNSHLYNTADCLIVVQTLNFLYNTKNAISEIRNILKYDGCAIITVSSITPVSLYDYKRWGDFWRFTDMALRELLLEFFSIEEIEIRSFGNYDSTMFYLSGACAEEVNESILNHIDPEFGLGLVAFVQKKT